MIESSYHHRYLEMNPSTGAHSTVALADEVLDLYVGGTAFCLFFRIQQPRV
jgi:hypothetical protein